MARKPTRETRPALRSAAGAGSAGSLVSALVLILVGGRARRRRLRVLGAHHPAALPALRHPAGELRAERGHQDLRRQRRADHRVPRRAPHLRARSPRCRQGAPRGRSSPPRTRASTPTSASIPMGIARAVYQNFRRGRIVEGGSTITQQLAKVLFLTPDKSLERKLKEAVLAARAGAPLLEGPHPRDVPEPDLLRPRRLRRRGGRAHLLRQVGRASSRLRESALLAGLPKAPSTYSPVRAPRGGEAPARHRARPHGGRRRAQGRRRPSGSATTDLGLIPPERRRTTGQYYLEYVQQYARGAVRRRPRLQGRTARLHHAVADHAAQGRALAARRASRRSRRAASPRPRTRTVAGARAPGGGAAHPRSADRLHQGHGGRLRLLQERVQPRRAGAPPARARPSSPSSTWRRSSPA